MRHLFNKFFIALLFLILTSYVSYNIIIKNNKVVSSSIINKIELISKSAQINVSTLIKSPRIFCIILTSLKSLDTKAKVVVNTWGKKCDNYKLVSLFPDSITTTNTMAIDVNKNVSNHTATEIYEIGEILKPPGLINDSYDKLTDKVYLTYKYLYNKYGDYDWYLKADDDTFIFVDNLRNFLKDKNPTSPITFGYDFKVIVNGGYHSGGGGYLLSREALARIGSKLTTNYEFCKNTGTEDVDVAKCLRSLDVYPEKSIDEFGRERFHPLSIEGHYLGQFPDWLFQFATNSLKEGLDCCSDTSISFHYMSSDEILQLDRVLKKLRLKYGEQNFKFKDIIAELKM